MRDSHDQLPEIVSVSQRDRDFFATIGVAILNQTRQFEIGITPDCYLSMVRILQERPFDKLPGVAYRYFFVPSIRRLSKRDKVEADFRIEQGKVARQFQFEIPKALAANLMWFFELKDFALASHLRCVDAK